MGDDVAGDRDRVAVAFGQMIGDAADAAVHLAAAERFDADFFLGRGIDQLRPAEEHRALVSHDDGFVAQRRHVGAAGGRRPVDDGDLRNAFARHPDLVVEDRAELAFVRKDIGLVRQVGAAGLHHGDAGQPVLPGKPLSADVLLAGDAVIGAALHRGIVGDDHAGAARHHADAGDDAAAGRHALIHAFAGELAEFEKRRARRRAGPRCVRAAATACAPCAAVAPAPDRRSRRRRGALADRRSARRRPAGCDGTPRSAAEISDFMTAIAGNPNRFAASPSRARRYS